MKEQVSAIILAAGKSTRLYPLTLTTPKVLLPLAGKPVINWTLGWLQQHEIRRAAINLHHLGEKVETYLGDGSQYGMQIKYSKEENLLGTALGAKMMSGFFSGLKVIIYGDVVCDLDLTAMIAFHLQRKAVATLALFGRADRRDVGGVKMTTDDRIMGFKERIDETDNGYDYANGGIYVADPSIFTLEDSREFSDFGSNLLPELVAKGYPVYGYKLGAGDYLMDMGTKERYRRVDADARAGKVKVIPL